MSIEETTAFNPETASLDQLEDQIRADWDAVEAPAAAEPAAVEEPKPAPVKFRREIDLGDGAGKQVFEADSMDGLVDALAQAQTHASRKIRELAREAKVETVTDTAQERDLTPDEDYMLSQQLLQSPSKTLKQLIEKIMGEPLEKFKARQARTEEVTAEVSAEKAAKEFVTNHADDFFACPENRGSIERYLSAYNLEATVANLEDAFKNLSASGLLKSRPPKADNGAGEAADDQETSRIATTPTTTPAPTRRGSGLSSSGRTAPLAKAAPTERELYNMPLDELERLANAELAGGLK